MSDKNIIVSSSDNFVGAFYGHLHIYTLLQTNNLTTVDYILFN